MGNHECCHLMGMFRCTHCIGNKRCAQFTQNIVPMGGLYDDFGFNGQSLGNNIFQDVAYWCAQWATWCAQLGLWMYWFWWEIIGVLNRNLLYSQMDIIGGLWKIIMCSTGHCWCAQQQIIGVHIVMGVSNIPNVRPGGICMPFISTFSHVWFLHGRSLNRNYWCADFSEKLLVWSTGNCYVLNWYAQWASILEVPWEIHGVHIAVGTGKYVGWSMVN